MCVKGVRDSGKGIVWSKTDCTEMPGSKLSSRQECSEWIGMPPVHGGGGKPSSLLRGNTGDATLKTAVLTVCVYTSRDQKEISGRDNAMLEFYSFTYCDVLDKDSIT